jgi:hypothetical protein
MKNVLLPTAAWPNLHFLFYLANCTDVVIEQHETYPRQTLRNRYEILSANGLLPLTIPVKRSGNHTKTRDVFIDYSSDWQTQHWRALTSAYRKSPFFEFFEDEVKACINKRHDLLLQYNLSQINLICKILRLQPSVSLSTQFEKEPAFLEDKRMIADPRYDVKNDRRASGVLSVQYYQTFGEKFGFIPNLSCLDLIFNIGLNARDHIRTRV